MKAADKDSDENIINSEFSVHMEGKRGNNPKQPLPKRHLDLFYYGTW